MLVGFLETSRFARNHPKQLGGLANGGRITRLAGNLKCPPYHALRPREFAALYPQFGQIDVELRPRNQVAAEATDLHTFQQDAFGLLPALLGDKQEPEIVERHAHVGGEAERPVLAQTGGVLPFGHHKVATDVGQHPKVEGGHGRQLGIAGPHSTTTGQQVQTFRLIELAALPADGGLHIHGMARGGIVLPELRERERRLETVPGRVNVAVHMMRAGNPANDTGDARCLCFGTDLLNGLLKERTRRHPATGALLSMCLIHQGIKGALRGMDVPVCHREGGGRTWSGVGCGGVHKTRAGGATGKTVR